ncbi:hypothetical protein QAD02_001853 [Eretmocerus hayati]|uniref:Uncharacterized protein n=1 Tax=Eretmocerus hayati TaxID=131215 RepID=A0ACC2NJV3_9HYME|nr:hypothetical protein QAD02_001853 [Eretmocerus hayati]
MEDDDYGDWWDQALQPNKVQRVIPDMYDIFEVEKSTSELYQTDLDKCHASLNSTATFDQGQLDSSTIYVESDSASYVPEDADAPIEPPIDITALDVPSRALAERDPRCLILVGVFGFCLTTLIGTFGFVPKLLNSNIIQQLVVLVIGKTSFSPPRPPTVPRPCVSCHTTTTTTTTTPMPEEIVETEPPPSEIFTTSNKTDEIELGDRQWEKEVKSMQIFDVKMQASATLLQGMSNWCPPSIKAYRKYGKNAERKAKLHRYSMYKKGYNVQLQAPPTIRTYRRTPMKKSCNAYLKQITHDRNIMRKAVLGQICMEAIKH